MPVLKDKDFVSSETLKTFSEIDGLRVIEEHLLFKGTDQYKKLRNIAISDLERMAHIAYGLKVSATNKLYVGMHLDKFYRRAGLLTPSGRIIIPAEIFQRVEAIHQQYKTADNQREE